jgi:hypothetical protein
MTKRLTAALLCVLALFAIGGVASADAKALSYRTAKTLAKRLADKQVRGRDVVSYHLLLPRRVSSSRITFQYDDRTADHVFCTALVIVDQKVSRRFTTTRARFSGAACDGIPSEALKFEAIIRATQRELRANTPATVDAVDAVNRSARRCDSLKVPRSREDEANALLNIAVIEALEQPNDAALGTFSDALLAVNAKSTALHAGAIAWADYLATIRALPQVDDPCALLKRWARNGYSNADAPIDFAAYRALDRRAAVDQRAIERAATRLASLGVFPNAAVGFTPEGLLRQLVAKTGITGGRQKVVLG